MASCNWDTWQNEYIFSKTLKTCSRDQDRCVNTRIVVIWIPQHPHGNSRINKELWRLHNSPSYLMAAAEGAVRVQTVGNRRDKQRIIDTSTCILMFNWSFSSLHTPNLVSLLLCTLRTKGCDLWPSWLRGHHRTQIRLANCSTKVKIHCAWLHYDFRHLFICNLFAFTTLNICTLASIPVNRKIPSITVASPKALCIKCFPSSWIR